MATQTQRPATDEEREVEILPGTGSLDRLTKAEIDVQISTAHAYPRSITISLRNLTSMVTLSAAVAEKCFYSLKRKDKEGKEVRIEGASVRFAELAASAWGNMRAAKRVADEDDHFIYGQGAAHDLESNNAITIEVSRRITSKRGRYNDDMIGVTGNAAASIAYRNAVLVVIPRALWLPIYEQARLTARGTMETLAERRKNAIAEFKKINVTTEMLFTYLEVKGIEDIGLDELMDLIGVFNAIKSGDATIASEFGEPEVKQPQRTAKSATEGNGNTEKLKDANVAATGTTATSATETVTAGAGTTETTKPGDAPISDEEVAKVYSIGQGKAWSIAQIKKHIHETYKQESVKNLTRDQVADLTDYLGSNAPPK